MAGFTIDLAGRVRNFDLPKNQPLIPLYEAIVNSIYAIQERQQKEEFDGKIEVEIIRDPQQVAEIEGIDKSINEITGFRIIDNGVGLDDNNMKSFLQSDSTYRADKGGKGVGRFSWLKAFSKTHIESVYKDENDGVWVKREFEFSLDKLDIDDRLVEEKGAFENRTCVSLIDYLPTYRKHVNKNAETIAMKIMQHCMIYLMSPKCPQICVIDEERYSINIHMDMNSLAHTKWNCKYHIVFAPKYRRKIIYGQLKRDLGNFHFKEGGQNYHSVGEVDEIQVIIQDSGSVKAPEYSHTANRSYAIVQNGKLKHLTFYDETHSQVVSIDLMHQHHGLYLLRHNNHSGDY